MFDEHISWRDHLRTVESKIAKSINLLHQSRQVVTEESFKAICFSYILSYIASYFQTLHGIVPMLQN